MQPRIVPLDAPHRAAPPKIEARFGCSATWCARTAVFSPEYTTRNKRYTRGTNQPNTNIFARLASRPEHSVESLFPNELFLTYVASVNLINRCEMVLGPVFYICRTPSRLADFLRDNKQHAEWCSFFVALFSFFLLYTSAIRVTIYMSGLR